MPRLRSRSLLIALVSLTLLAGAGAPAIAQDATPAAGEIQTQFLSAGAALAGLPYVPAGVALARITFGPHSEGTPGPDPFASLTLVESGTITLQADQAVMIIPGGAPGGAEEPASRRRLVVMLGSRDAWEWIKQLIS